MYCFYSLGLVLNSHTITINYPIFLRKANSDSYKQYIYNRASGRS